MRPMLASHAPIPGVVPQGSEWVHEVKWDGIRLMAEMSEGVLRLTNRTGGEVSVTYPELHRPTQLPDDVLLDGEVVALGTGGVANLASLAPRMHQRDPRKVAQLAARNPAQFMVFDVLRLGGHSLLDLPLHQRRELLESLDLGANGPGWQVPPQYSDGVMLAEVTAEAGLEGVISKRLDSTYQPGVRSTDWLKVPHRHEFVGVIGGWVPETQNPRRLGALWVGHPHDEATFEQTGLLYPITRVGSGLPQAQREELLEALHELAINRCPFMPAPLGPEARRSHWVEPVLCVQVRYLGRPGGFSQDAATAAGELGQLRQPVLRRLRPDVDPLQSAHVEV